MKNTVIIAHIRNNGFEINKPFEIEYTDKLLRPKAKETITITAHESALIRDANEVMHVFTLSDGARVEVWDHLISKSSEELNQIYDA